MASLSVRLHCSARCDSSLHAASEACTRRRSVPDPASLCRESVSAIRTLADSSTPPLPPLSPQVQLRQLTSAAAPTKSLSTGSIVVVDASADAEKLITLVHCQNVSFLMGNFVLL